MQAVATFPAPHTRLGVGGVLIRDRKVLVNRASYREDFTIPSGYVEPGESLEDAVLRELFEETSVRARVGPLVLNRHRVVDPHESDVYFAFQLEYVSGDPLPVPPEIVEVRELPVSEALKSAWISGLSRLAIRLAAEGRGWSRASGDGWIARSSTVYELYHEPK
jgi:8-oxo-dGTP diphosphatase